jgi:hypothetical protein
MSADLNALETLDLEQLDLPRSLPVTGIEIEDYVDSTGDDALRVTLVLDESVDPAKISGGDVIQLKSAIRNAIAARGVRRFAYIFLVKESERQEETD